MTRKIYTKGGDTGETSLFGGARLSKNHVRIDAYGSVDELNAHVGYLYELVDADEVRTALFKVQNDLFDIGAVLALDPDKAEEFKLPCVEADDVSEIEKWIDQLDATLPPLKQFVLPSGHPQGAYAHIARTVCRRAERAVVALASEAAVPAVIVTYLNRLSDYFFVLARYLTLLGGGEERKWSSRST
jgi:cob(I)alamin adenosyltransferase